ncbi:hypothetical protein ACWEF9_39310, partial [Streptomyces sp. NPDC004980]
VAKLVGHLADGGDTTLGSLMPYVLGFAGARLPWTFAWTAGALALAVVAGYVFGSIRVAHGPSAVLGLGAVYLPSILWSIPTSLRNWPTGAAPVSEATAGRVALAITIGGAAALLLLYRIRPVEPAPTATP